MTKSEIKSSLKNHHGQLSGSTDKCFEGITYDYVAKFDSGLDSEQWSDETGLGGPSEIIDGIFHTWFDNDDDPLITAKRDR